MAYDEMELGCPGGCDQCGHPAPGHYEGCPTSASPCDDEATVLGAFSNSTGVAGDWREMMAALEAEYPGR